MLLFRHEKNSSFRLITVSAFSARKLLCGCDVSERTDKAARTLVFQLRNSFLIL